MHYLRAGNAMCTVTVVLFCWQVESVQLAVQLLHDSTYRDHKISVEKVCSILCVCVCVCVCVCAYTHACMYVCAYVHYTNTLVFLQAHFKMKGTYNPSLKKKKNAKKKVKQQK